MELGKETETHHHTRAIAEPDSDKRKEKPWKEVSKQNTQKGIFDYDWVMKVPC